MKILLDKIHAKLGDFWWYSLMVFCAARVADCMNVFVGLWLVPKYVDPKDLGAVMPLTQFASCLAIPIAVFASTFRNEITELSIKQEFGKLKTLLRGTFVATGIFLVFALLVSWVILPPFLERIRIAKGSLGILVIITAFVGSVSPIFNNALQALKKFKATSVIGILGAPLRLLTMLATMPLRPLSGYFVGQCATPSFGIVASIFALKNELAVKAEPYWNKEVFRRVARFGMMISIATVFPMVSQLVEFTVLRQRIPQADSAAYYVVTRFSEISNFITCTLVFTMFPYTASLARGGLSTKPLIFKMSGITVLLNIVIAVAFALCGEWALSFVPHGECYQEYAWAIQWLIVISVLSAISSYYTTSEISANRFGYLKWLVPINVIYPLVMLLVTGYGYFDSFLPDSWSSYLSVHNIKTLDSLLMWSVSCTAIKTIFCMVSLHCHDRNLRVA